MTSTKETYPLNGIAGLVNRDITEEGVERYKARYRGDQVDAWIPASRLDPVHIINYRVKCAERKKYKKESVPPEKRIIDYQNPLPDEREEQLSNYIADNLIDPFEQTIFKGYKYVDPKQKGGYGERRISHIMEYSGHDVKAPVNTGHDRILDKIKTELKFSLACKGKPDSFTLNHVSKGKDWDRLIFLGINLDMDNRMYWMSKEAFIADVDSDNMSFGYQQGGKKLKNDDYMISGSKLMGLVAKGIFRPMDEW